MKGKYHFEVRSKRTVFAFDITRNISVIKGDSGTGKTTLLRMMYEYLLSGRESGFSVYADAPYFVYLRGEIGRSWEDILTPLHNNVVFIEENNNFVFSKDFAEYVGTSDNYFVIVNRSPIKVLPYSVHAIYEIVSGSQHPDVKESFHELRELYSNYPDISGNRMEHIITEDSNSGYQFYLHLFSDSQVISANGNTNIISRFKEIQGDTLVISDGAAFGAMVEDCMAYSDDVRNHRIAFWMPESFEYILLSAHVVSSAELNDILRAPYNYIECSEYISWERYFTDLLIRLSDGISKYSKTVLNAFYLQDKNIKKVIDVMPEPIRKRAVERRK